jgi:hypothetical protein
VGVQRRDNPQVPAVYGDKSVFSCAIEKLVPQKGQPRQHFAKVKPGATVIDVGMNRIDLSPADGEACNAPFSEADGDFDGAGLNDTAFRDHDQRCPCPCGVHRVHPQDFRLD